MANMRQEHKKVEQASQEEAVHREKERKVVAF